MVIYKPLRITCTCHVRALAQSELDVRASGTAIRLRPHGGIEFHVTAAMGPRKKRNRNQDHGQQNGGRKKGFARTLTMLISNLTESVFRPTLSNTSGSATSPVGGGDTCCCCCCRGVAATKSGGIGGRVLVLAGEFERRPGDSSSGCSVAETSSG